jgi:hypothetical protein
MKPRFSKQERGQGCIEFIVGLVIIVIIVLAIIWAITELVTLIKKNIIEIQSTTPTPTVEITDIPVTKVPETFEPESGLPILETEMPEEIPTPVITIMPTISTATPGQTPSALPTPTHQPEKPIWEQFLDWFNN